MTYGMMLLKDYTQITAPASSSTQWAIRIPEAQPRNGNSDKPSAKVEEEDFDVNGDSDSLSPLETL
jgi:hypothetical protein